MDETGIDVGVKVGVGVGGMGEDVAFGVVTGAPHPTTNDMINVNSTIDCHNFLQLILASFLDSSNPARPTARASPAPPKRSGGGVGCKRRLYVIAAPDTAL
ncbi:MAG: hypothetical protein FJZ86_08660 [Chloroflexi bacterium]|nr:hypothetical protein [Chloroflexota bacterium]